MIKLLEIEGEIIVGKFLERVNKFLILMDCGERILQCRLVETGRLPRLLEKNVKVACLKKEGRRKTFGDVLGVYKDGKWWLTNTNYHRYIVEKILELRLLPLPKYSKIILEYKYGDSRIDFYLDDEAKILLEVKGVSLFIGDYGYYPDAPTERGRKHILTLMRALNEGYHSYILFLSMSRAKAIRINWEIDPKFGEAFIRAIKSGVKALAVAIKFNLREIYFDGIIPIDIQKEK